MQRIYQAVLEAHLCEDKQMLFVSGPRQVGKTTVCKRVEASSNRLLYLNWDDENHREVILAGPARVVSAAQIEVAVEQHPIVVFDEIHKRPDWKNFLKGLYDTYGDLLRVIVCGSARLDVYKQGGDSLMGRYFSYRIHPVSVAECLTVELISTEIRKPKKIDADIFDALYAFGGFPEPFLKQSKTFSLPWQQMRKQQLLREDIRDVNLIHDLNRLDILFDLLKHRAAQSLTQSTLAKLIKTSVDTVVRWIEILESFYYCFRIRPWTKNISRSLIKEPKVYLWDWSLVDDAGARAENFIASHLLKAVHHWTDRGLGEYGLHYIRSKEKKEVDFVVTKDGEAWFLVEVKCSGSQGINPNLAPFQAATGAAHAFQVVLDMPYVNQDCFQYTTPKIVSAKTFLSQLL